MKSLVSRRPLETERQGRRERKSEETKLRIVQSAVRLLQQRTFSQITVEQITEAADVGKGTFFNYFPSKEHVILALIAQVGKLFQQSHAELARSTDVRKTLFQFVHFIDKNPPRTPVLMRNILGIAMTNEFTREPFQEFLRTAQGALTVLLARGQEIGQVRRDVPAEQLSRCLQQIIFGTQAIWSIHGHGDLEGWLDDSLDLAWSGLAAPIATTDGKKLK